METGFIMISTGFYRDNNPESRPTQFWIEGLQWVRASSPRALRKKMHVGTCITRDIILLDDGQSTACLGYSNIMHRLGVLLTVIGMWHAMNISPTPNMTAISGPT